MALAKALDSTTVWSAETFEELPNVLYWLKQVTAIVLGIVAAAAGDAAVGYAMLLVVPAFLFVNTGISYVYHTKFLTLEEDEFDAKDLVMEGLGPSVSCFFGTWVVLHTMRTAAGVAVDGSAAAAL